MASADLTVWVAGNQFIAMTRVIGDFQAQHPGLGVGLITLPPGMILKAIQAHGWSLGDARLMLHPDIFATVSVAQLRDTAEVSSYIVYMHNALELMVAKGNPKHVRDLNDLTWPDLRVMLPNPLTEGIMTFYAKPILQRQGLGPSCRLAPIAPIVTPHRMCISPPSIIAKFRPGSKAAKPMSGWSGGPKHWPRSQVGPRWRAFPCHPGRMPPIRWAMSRER